MANHAAEKRLPTGRTTCPSPAPWCAADSRPAHALSIDVEEYFQVTAFASTIARSDWEALPSRLEVGLLRVLDLLDRHRTRATFFVLGWIAERHGGLVKEIAGRGHEIACHGYAHELVWRQSEETFRDETRRARQAVEQAAGVEVVGYRASTWSIRGSTRWALDVLAGEGFLYDSSCRTRAVASALGCTIDSTGSFGVECAGGKWLLEFPASSLSLGARRLPMGGGGYLRLFPCWATAAFLRRVERRGEPGNVYLHPWELDPEQPRVNAGRAARFRHYVGLNGLGDKLERLLRQFRFGTVRSVLGV